jgi:hypothetical protein
LRRRQEFDYAAGMIAPGQRLARTATPAFLVLSMLMMDAGLASAQTAPPQPGLGLQEQGAPPAAPPQQPQPAPNGPAPAKENSGLIHDMGKLFDKVMPTIKSPSETLDDLNVRAKEAAKDAGDTFSRLTRTGSIASGRLLCPPDATGTADCKLAADRLCQGKGFKEGRSLATDAAEHCSAKVLIPGRARKPGDCRTDNYVTAALCE